ncbi:MAG: 5-methylthioadenosine/S-adenosylhomocysteine deaminase [Thermoplasmata archaeon]|jgi:5-methylthioadenosine/S-adenosylhomocysteine deaminase|nr:5-methylthioadenosine/S-adenosylhomocysteine deaminase [Thermoplasmata archaeon]
MTSLRIRNATIVTQDDARRTVQGDLFVEDGRIVAVGTPDAKREADRELDGTGQVVLPGLINLHTHLAMGLLRAIGDDMPLEAWLRERIWPAEERITEPIMRAGVELGLAEMIAGGTTSFLDMYWMEESVVAPACRSVGMRGWLGEGFVDVGQTNAGEPNRKLAPLERFVKAAKKDPLVTPCPAPHGAYTCNPETYTESARIASEHGVPLHTHCSETRTEVHDVQARTGARPVARIAQAGALGKRTVLAHCGWITKGEVADIATAGASVAHCPVSNMKLATGGVAPVVELQEAGVRVGLGTDGAASNNGLDLFETMKFAALAQKQHRWDATALPANAALDMATRHAADALHRPDLGRIVPGATADIVMVDFRRPHLVPRHDAVSHLVYSASGRDVSATVVGGRVLMAHGRHETLDLPKVLAAAQAAGDALVRPA